MICFKIYYKPLKLDALSVLYIYDFFQDIPIDAYFITWEMRVSAPFSIEHVQFCHQFEKIFQPEMSIH